MKKGSGCMENITKNCMFKGTCKKKDTQECNSLCYPFVVLHGQKGIGGFWGTTGIPRKYKNITLDTLPIQEENPRAYETVKKYIERIAYFIEDKGLGLFMYSIPNKENLFGTGTGKTTTATAIINEYVLNATRRHLIGDKELKNNPAIFVKASELQNKYNAQFRGTVEMQQESSIKFYRLKDRMKAVALLVIDDIAIRDTTEAFRNELYEIIDHRATEELATIFTSNFPRSELTAMLGERIVSRIEGMTLEVGFKGRDFRKGGLLNG